MKFNDADLIGCPYQVVIGKKNLSHGLMEFKERRPDAVMKLAPIEIAARLKELLIQFGIRRSPSFPTRISFGPLSSDRFSGRRLLLL